MHNMSNTMWIFLLSFLCLLTAPLTAQTTGLCGDGVRACMNHYVTYTLKHANEQRLDLMCQDVNELMVCVFALDCLEEDKKEQIVREVRREIAAQGFVCEVDLDSVTTRAPGQERSTLSADTSTCLGATEACTKSYVEASLKLGGQTKEEVVEKFCPKISEYLDCLIYSPCNLEQVKEVFREKVEKKLEEQGIECDLNYYEKEGLRDNNENGLRDNNENGANRYLMSGGAVILVVLSTWCLWFKSDF